MPLGLQAPVDEDALVLQSLLERSPPPAKRRRVENVVAGTAGSIQGNTIEIGDCVTNDERVDQIHGASQDVDLCDVRVHPRDMNRSGAVFGGVLDSQETITSSSRRDVHKSFAPSAPQTFSGQSADVAGIGPVSPETCNDDRKSVDIIKWMLAHLDGDCGCCPRAAISNVVRGGPAVLPEPCHTNVVAEDDLLLGNADRPTNLKSIAEPEVGWSSLLQILDTSTDKEEVLRAMEKLLEMPENAVFASSSSSSSAAPISRVDNGEKGIIWALQKKPPGTGRYSVVDCLHDCIVRLAQQRPQDRYKIGITTDPYRRFEHADWSYRKAEGGKAMYILAATSVLEVPADQTH